MTKKKGFARLSAADRSTLMGRIRKKDTKPELVVRRLVHGMGYRFRLHRRNLPGTPDLVFPGLRKIIFVHGCFWHQHDCHLGRKQPRSNIDYWTPKLERNVVRDGDDQQRLRLMGWNTLVVWECEVSEIDSLRSRLDDFLSA